MDAITNLRQISNKICKHFKIPNAKILIGLNEKNYLGIYLNDVIQIRYSGDIPTLLHELAHHLKEHRWLSREKGYYQTFQTREMELDYIDIEGKKWYAPNGKSIEIQAKIGNAHGKLFKDCLKEIKNYYYKYY